MATVYEITKVCDADGCGQTEVSEVQEITDESSLNDYCTENDWVIDSPNGDFCPGHSYLAEGD